MAGSDAIKRRSTQNFTASVRIDPLFDAKEQPIPRSNGLLGTVASILSRAVTGVGDRGEALSSEGRVTSLLSSQSESVYAHEC